MKKKPKRVVSYTLPPEDIDLVLGVAAARTLKKGELISASAVIRDLIQKARARLERELQ